VAGVERVRCRGGGTDPAEEEHADDPADEEQPAEKQAAPQAGSAGPHLPVASRRGHPVTGANHRQARHVGRRTALHRLRAYHATLVGSPGTLRTHGGTRCGPPWITPSTDSYVSSTSRDGNGFPRIPLRRSTPVQEAVKNTHTEPERVHRN